MILPVMEYGDILYDGANKKLTGRLKVSTYPSLTETTYSNYKTARGV